MKARVWYKGVITTSVEFEVESIKELQKVMLLEETKESLDWDVDSIGTIAIDQIDILDAVKKSDGKELYLCYECQKSFSPDQLIPWNGGKYCRKCFRHILYD